MDRKLQRHRAVSLRQHGFLVSHGVKVEGVIDGDSEDELRCNQFNSALMKMLK